MSSYERDSICIYIDLENIESNLDIKKIMQDIIIKYETNRQDNEPIFVYKIACGNSASITKYREQLKGLNYEIRETPHLVNKKNRSDLIISLDAFEKLYLDRPSINEYVFITNDSDFSVIMDILRRYSKKVILVTTKEDSTREIFNNCADKILIMDDYLVENKKIISEENEGKNFNEDNIAIEYLLIVLEALDPDKEYLSAQIGSKFKDIDKSFDIGKTSFKKFNKLADYFEEQGLIKIDAEKNQYDRVITLINGEKEMDWVVDTNLKTSVATEMLKANLSIIDICEKYKVNPRQARAWAKIVHENINSDTDS
jgi:predicted nuclease of predicted toxin-antitoxin system